MAETPKTNNRNAKKDDYLVQGAILAAAAVLTKIIGVVYRIPLTNILGDEGNGFYGYAYQVYAIALMLSSFSLPTAVSNWFPQDWRYVREEMRSVCLYALLHLRLLWALSSLWQSSSAQEQFLLMQCALH